jgi:hypothetical protein
MAEASATAEGELARTPLAHLLVYALDRRLTGVLFLAPPKGEEHVVRLSRGVPVKVRPGDQFALLGELLIEAGAIDEKTLEAALATKGLLGDVLLLAGRIERDTLEKVAEDQFRRRMVRLFALPPEATYRYYDGHDELAEYGGDPANVDPLALLWDGLRTHGELSAMMEGTLTRLGDTPLRLHPSATVARFGLGAEESKLLEEIAAKPITLAELCAASFPGLARRLVYALAITRQLEAGTAVLPLGVEVLTSQRNAPPTAVARMALRSTVHRVGAAAPDAPGDGERGAPMVIPNRKARERPSGDGATEEPASGRTSTPPESDDAPVSQPVSGPGTATSPGPESGVVAVDGAPRAVETPPEVAEEGTQPLVDRSTEVESTTLQSGIGVPMKTLRASAPDLLVEVEVAPFVDVLVEEAPPVEASVEVVEAESDAFAGMSASELFWLATEAMAERDVAAALEACDAGRRLAPDDPDLAALEAWARAQLGGADVKALAVQLDLVIGTHDKHVEARYYRGMLRRRLGDEAGCLRDLRYVVELSPKHEGACQELATIEDRQKAKERPSLFGKLFKR